MQALRFILFILGASGAWTLYQESQNTLADNINSGNYGILVLYVLGGAVVVLCFWGASVIGDRLQANGTASLSLRSGEVINLTGLVFTLDGAKVDRILRPPPDSSTHVDIPRVVASRETRPGEPGSHLLENDSERLYLKHSASALASGTLDKLLGTDTTAITAADQTAPITTIQRFWSSQTHAELRAAAARLGDYSAEAAQAINAELKRRGSDQSSLSSPPSEVHQPTPPLSDEVVKDWVATYVVPIKQRYPGFFIQWPPSDGEFLVAWADKHLLTNRRLVLFPEPAKGAEARSIDVAAVASYRSTPSRRPSPL